MNLLRAMAMSAIASLIGACATQPNMMSIAEFALEQPAPTVSETQITGAASNNGMALFGDMRSYQDGDFKVGDRVTVLLSETTRTSRSSDISTSRSASNNVVTEAKIGRGTDPFSDFKLAGGSVISEGTGTADQAASLTGSISAMVVEVLSNDNLVILGEKQLALTEGSEFIRLKGIIRPADIQADNTLLSHRIASAQISYRGKAD